MAWRMLSKCADCPFASSGPGLHLRKTLDPGRWREILHGLRTDRHFHCHKTTDETGDGTNLVCAGSLEWSEKHNVSQNFCRVLERVEHISEHTERVRKDA